MRVRLLLFVLGAVALSIPFRASASVVSICNQGDASLNVTTAVYSKSVWLGDSYHVTGWYAVEPDKCTVFYSAEDPEDVYQDAQKAPAFRPEMDSAAARRLDADAAA